MKKITIYGFKIFDIISVWILYMCVCVCVWVCINIYNFYFKILLYTLT